MSARRQKFQEISSLVALLKDCAKEKDLAKGYTTHASIVVQRGLQLQEDTCIANSLISLYVKCDALASAQKVFDQLHFRTVVSWNALIMGYARHGNGQRALDCFKCMKHEGVAPDEVTFLGILKVCDTMVQEIGSKSKEIHTEIVSGRLLERNVLVGSALIDMYAKCGKLIMAHEVFDRVWVRNVVSWNALMVGYAHYGQGEKVLDCVEVMRVEGLSPDGVTFVCILKACGSIKSTVKGKETHAEIQRQGLLEKNVLIANALVDMYAKCGLLTEAQDVFELLPIRNIVSWSTLIAGYAEHGYPGMSLDWFEVMKVEGFTPNPVTFICILKACGSIASADKGEKIHAEVIMQGLVGTDDLIGNALLDMYAKCGAVFKAQEVFDQLHAHDVICWTTLISGYTQHGLSEEALNCFERMKHEGLSPNSATFTVILKACSNIRAAGKGREIHAEIVREGLFKRDTLLGTAVMDMYAKCGALVQARQAFDQLEIQDLVSWNTLIAGYAEEGNSEEALNCFKQMQSECLFPNAATFVCALKACGIIGASKKAKEIHVEIMGERLLERDISVGNALLDIYAKCAEPFEAHAVFRQLPLRDLVSWTALMAAYCQIGEDDVVVNLFDKLIQDGIEPDVVTFTVVLNACSHSGLLEKGEGYFEVMCTCYCITPTIEHYTCMIDLFSRAGHFCKAVAMIRQVPSSDHLPAWTALLARCL